MKLTLSKDSLLTAAVDVLVVGVTSPKAAKDDRLARIDRAMNGAVTAAISHGDFKAKTGESVSVQGRGRMKARRVVFVGLGDKPLTEKDARVFAIRAGRIGASEASVALAYPSEDNDTLRSLADGVLNGAYRYTRYLTGARKPKRELKKALILVSPEVAVSGRDAVAAGTTVAEAVNFARDLVNCPPNDLTPTALANAAAEASKEAGIECTVHDKKGIQKLGMNLLLAVNSGSKEEPRFVHMIYKPKNVKSAPKVVLVGKGLTFDSGGLCVKPSGSMLTMKCDMAGAAVTIATVIAAAKLGLPVEVHGIVGSTDNMTGGDAYRPGDVFTSLDGKTVEIINTDAEGRLVLADALAYARELKPDYLIDHATLTGACVVALGDYTAGLFGNNDEAIAKYREAANASGESYWQMPLDSELRDQLKSDIADLKHTGARMGGAITAALFLQEFIGKSTWLHLDIAGPSFLERSHTMMPKGGTGFGVLTAIQFLRSLGSA